MFFYLYNLDELPLDVPLDDLRLGVRVLLHLDGGVHRHRAVHLVELVHFAVNEDGREGGQGHRGVDLENSESKRKLYRTCFDIIKD